MRVLVLWFPRLAAQLAVRARPELEGRAFVFVAGAGGEALVAACSAAASACGVLAGMTAGQARSRCPRAVFLPDNAGACLDELDRIAAILRTRATSLVALEGRSHLAIDVTACAASANEEAFIARRLTAYALAWGGFEVRAGVASSRSDALDAARASRGTPVVCPGVDWDEAAVGPYRRDAAVSGRWSQSHPASAGEARARLGSLLERLGAVLQARGESSREVPITLAWADETRMLTLRPPAPVPVHTASDALALARDAVGLATLDGLVGCAVSLSRLGPDVRTRPCAANASGRRDLAGITVSLAREPLRRAS